MEALLQHLRLCSRILCKQHVRDGHKTGADGTARGAMEKQRREVRRNGTQTWKKKRKGRDGKSNRGKDRGKTQQWEEGREAAEESKGSA